MSSEGRVAALLEERRGYKLRGLKSRVAEVDAELGRLGYVADDSGDQDSPPAAAGYVEEAGGGSARRRSGRRG